MIKKQYFTIRESLMGGGNYMIEPIHENFPLNYTTGSFAVICARVMGLTWAQWLRFCRDQCGARILGRHTYYPVAYFKKGKMLSILLRLLNARMYDILHESHVEDMEKLINELIKEKQNETEQAE